uniref:transketolase n=1 Tax=Timema monikensis TaxID=170555 RepID=A0A7R9E227_9NEOP|nr:unnamed protein product [Timema monikensis]
MKYKVLSPKDPSNDRFVLSKGHAAPILYGVWVELGMYTKLDITNLRKLDSDLEGHPTPRLPFIDIATGSLGQGLSAAAGMAYVGKYIDKASYKVYCVIGDGECAEGSIWEALHFSSYYNLDNLCVLFDINRLGQSQPTSLQHDMETYKKRLSAFGLNAIVVDGHNITELVKALHDAAITKEKPTAILAKTLKGKCFPGIEDQENWHGKPLGDMALPAINILQDLIEDLKITNKDIPEPYTFVQNVDKENINLSSSPNYSLNEMVATKEVYENALVKLATNNKRVIVFDGDTNNSTFSNKFRELSPDNFIQCFIAEQNLVGVAIGAACRDRTVPFVSTFAAFLTRSFDQIRMGAISQTNVNFCGSHCGISIGEDGPSQMGLEDIAMFRTVPGATIFYPSDAVSCERAVELAANTKGICYIRTSRPNTPVIYKNNERFEIGRAKIIEKSNDDEVLVITAGITFKEAMRARKELIENGINIRLLDPFTIKPIDKITILKNAEACKFRILTVEDHYSEGGLGEAVLSVVACDSRITVKKLAVEQLPRSGAPDELLDMFGINARALTSLSYEKVCVLFNIAALQSSVAAAQSIESDEGLKLAAKLLQQSAGIFNHLKGNVMLAIQQEPTPDLNPETLGALSALMLAQAQEIFVQKAIHDRMKDLLIAKLSSQCEELYAEVMKQFQKELLRPLWEKEWISTVAGKQAAYHGLAEYYGSLVAKNNKLIGEEIARLENAMRLFKEAQTRSGKPSYFQDHANKAQRALTEAKKDNDFIYHERIPDAKSLPSLGKAQLVKLLPVPERLSQNFKDLFEELVPVVVHQAIAQYDVRKNEIVNTEIMKLRESTQLLNSMLASLNLPAALEDTSGDAVPQSLLDKAAAVQSLGGLQALETMIRDLPELLQRNTDILNEAERMLRDEKESDDQLREQFKAQWTRTPSEKLTETFHVNAAKYREIINNAVTADKVVKNKFETHRRGMELLSRDSNEMQAALPKVGSNGAGVQESTAVNRLRILMEGVETIKAERDTIEHELKSATVDMKQSFLSALAKDGAIDEHIMSVENLGKVFGPLQRQVKESLEKQEALMADIQAQNTEFCKEKSGAGAAAQRETILKEIAAAHDAFMELQNNLKEGAKFYNDLTQLLVVFQNKISDYCFARKTEKEELMKDLTQNIGRQQFGATPSLPAHYGSTAEENKKVPPPRPPPPTTSPSTSQAPQTLPYPMYPSGMPIPYGATTAAPYPAYMPPPMPGGYNPYAGAAPYPQQPQGEWDNTPPQHSPYPQQPQGAYGYPYPQQQYAGYQYPQQPPQQPPHQGHPW